jgi:fructokinase
VNEEELEFLFPGADPAHGADELRARGPTLAIVTFGDRGCYFRSASGSGTVPGFTIPVVDTTGAGDGFVAGLLAELPPETPPGEVPPDALSRILSFANAAGALICTRKGAIPALPTREQVVALVGGTASRKV